MAIKISIPKHVAFTFTNVFHDLLTVLTPCKAGYTWWDLKKTGSLSVAVPFSRGGDWEMASLSVTRCGEFVPEVGSRVENRLPVASFTLIDSGI